MRRLLPLLAALAIAGPGARAADFVLTILHNNDVHARVEPATFRGTAYGGYARLATLVRRLRAEETNPLLLSAGDVFQGTLYFNVYEGLADLAAMNAIGFQAMAVGNHEFDRGPKPLVEFARRARFPMLAANLDVSADEGLRELVRPSAVVEVGGQRIGLVGAIVPDLFAISSPGETVRMRPLRESVQAAVDDLTAQGVRHIVLLSHIGFDEDRRLVAELRNVDAVVGGHSHTPLGPSLGPNLPAGTNPYPTMVTDADGVAVPVAQVYQWGTILGRLRLTFDAAGRVTKAEGAPVAVSADIEPDPEIDNLVAAFRRPIEAVASQPVGETPTGLAGDRNPRDPERPIGNAIADAQLAAVKAQGAVVAVMNDGGVRAPIDAGKITYGHALAVQPFTNTIVVMDLTGAELRAMLEWGARSVPESSGGLLHVSAGSRYTIDASKPVGSRVVEAVVAGAPLDDAKTYRVAVNSFVAAGGDGHEVPKAAKGYRYDTGIVDVEALVDFLRANTPISRGREGRIRVVGL